MTATVDISRLKQKIIKEAIKHEAVADAAIKVTAEQGRNHAIELMKNSPPGKPYKRWSSPKGNYREGFASIAGNPPRSDRGRMIESFFIRLGRLSATIWNNVGYTKMLDEGTDKMKARPFKKKVGEFMKRQLMQNLITAYRRSKNG